MGSGQDHFDKLYFETEDMNNGYDDDLVASPDVSSKSPLFRC